MGSEKDEWGKERIINEGMDEKISRKGRIESRFGQSHG